MSELEEKDGRYERDSDAGVPSGDHDDFGGGMAALDDDESELFLEGDIRPGGTYVAELGLLKSLRKPRDFGRLTQEGRQLNEISILKDADGNPVAPDALQAYRVDHDAELNRITKAELDEVKSLHHQGVKAAVSSTGFAKIHNLAEQRKVRHDKAFDEYTEDRKQAFAEVEKRVLSTGIELKDSLTELDAQIAAIFAELNDADILVTKGEDYVLQRWQDINDVCRARSERISQFEADLDGVEQFRAESVGSRLQRLVRDLVGIAHQLPPTIERLAEDQAITVNLITIANRRDYADVVARLRREDVVAYHAHRNRWERRRKAWRLLKHDRAVKRYRDMLNSPRYVNPPERAALVAALRAAQAARHEERLAVIAGLAQLVPPRLSSPAVAEVKETLEQADAEEQADNRARYEAMISQAEATVTGSRTALEELRAELHAYGALMPEGDFGPLRAAIGEVLGSGEEMDAFLVRSGGLKQELGTIHASLGLATLIYEAPLAALTDRAQFVASGLGLDALLETQGKADVRTGLQDTLERMRTARRADMPAILPSLLKQVTTLGAVVGLPDRLASELEAAREHLEEVVAEVRAAGGPGGTTVGGRSTVGARSVSRKSAAAPSVAGGRSVAGKSVRSKGGRSSRRSSQGSHLSGATGGVAALLNMTEIRAVQRRVGSLVYACELPEGLQATLKLVVEACARQKAANEVVDGVLARDCAPLIDAREGEYAALVGRIGRSLAEQATRLHRSGEKVCHFFAQVAAAAEKQAALEVATDEKAQDDLDGALDDYEEADEAREARLKRALKRVRHAPDEAALERNLEAAMGCLQDIEDGYREYHHIATSVANEHPVLVNDNLRRYRVQLCGRFELIFPKAAEVDGVEPDEAKAKADAEAKAKAAEEGDEEDGEGGEGGEAQPEAGKEAEGEGEEEDEEAAAAKAAAKAEAEAAAKAKAEAEAAALDIESLKAYNTAAGTEYREKLSCKDIAARMLDSEDEDESEPEEEEGEAGEEAAEAQPEADSKLAEAEAEAKGDGEGEGEGEEAEAKSAAGEAGEEGEEAAAAAAPTEDANGTPLDPDGNPCTAFLEIRASQLGKVMRALRNHILHEFDTVAAQRRRAMAKLRKERVETVTEELEERLRRHWPRKGHAETKVKQPREGELIAHKQRQERHARNILARDGAQQATFEAVLAEATADVGAFAKRQAALERALPSRTNLASLQGVLQKCKRFRQDFKEACEAWYAKLEPFVGDEPRQLRARNGEFLRSCKLFSQGGEYAKEEVAISQRALQRVEDVLSGRLDSRQAAIDGLVDAQQGAMTSFAAFQGRFDECLQDLSMREGLGQKYGGPRRNATERLRTEFSWSDAAEAAIARDMDELERLCGCEPGSDADNVEGGPLAQRIVSVAYRIRQAQHRRGAFLQAFAEGCRAFNLEAPVPLEDSRKEAAAAQAARDAEPVVELSEEEAAAEAKAKAHTFMAAMRLLKERCEADTRALYEAEGKELPGGDIPASLQAFLTEQMAKAEEQRYASCRTFREQVARFQGLLLTAPVVALRDVTERCKERCATYTTVEEKKFAKVIGAYEAAKEAHKTQLKPQLSDPNQLPVLQALCEREAERSGDVRAAVVAAREKILATQHKGCDKFMDSLLFYTEKWMTLLDDTIIVTDLAALPGDEDIVPERMSLKRLKKNLRKREAEKKANPDAEVVLGPATKVLRPREWPGLELGKFVEPAKPEWLLEVEAGKGEEAEAAAGATEEAEEAKVSPTLKSYYTPATRHVFRTRQECYDAFLEWYKSHSSKSSELCTTLWNAEADWESNWKKMVLFLRDTQ